MKGISYRNRNEGKKGSDGKTKSANWSFRFEMASIGGKRKFFEKSGFRTKQEAVQAGTKAYREYTTCGSFFQETGMSYSDCLDSWLKNYVEIRCVQCTQYTYRKLVDRHVRPALGKYALSSIKRDTIQSFINEIFLKQYSRNTVMNLLGVVSNSLRYARKQGWIEVNPTSDIDLPSARQFVQKQNRQKIREPVPPYVLSRIFERFPEGHPEHLSLMLAYHCGLRLGEVFGLTWENVDLNWGSIYVEQQVQWSQMEHAYRIVPPKYDSKRRVRLDDIIWELLKREKARQDNGRKLAGADYKQLYADECGRLNCEKRGRPVFMVNTRPDGSYIQERVTQHAAQVIKYELGYEKFDFHSLRHTHATELSEAGVNLKEIQRRLGHSTMDITSKCYLHATDRMETESVELMNRMHNGEMQKIKLVK